MYEFALAPTIDGDQKGVAVVRCLEPGQGLAQDAARDMIDDLDPEWLLVVGIAGGVPLMIFRWATCCSPAASTISQSPPPHRAETHNSTSAEGGFIGL